MDGGNENNWSELYKGFGRLEGKVDQLLAAQVVHKETTDDHEHRIRGLEKGQWRRVGVVSGAGGVIGAFVAVMTKIGVIPS